MSPLRVSMPTSGRLRTAAGVSMVEPTHIFACSEDRGKPLSEPLNIARGPGGWRRYLGASGDGCPLRDSAVNINLRRVEVAILGNRLSLIEGCGSVQLPGGTRPSALKARYVSSESAAPAKGADPGCIFVRGNLRSAQVDLGGSDRFRSLLDGRSSPVGGVRSRSDAWPVRGRVLVARGAPACPLTLRLPADHDAPLVAA